MSVALCLKFQSNWNLFNACYQSCLSISLSYLPHQYTGLHNSAVKQQMPFHTMLLLYWFWLTKICICRKPDPTRDETRRVIYKLHSQWHSYFWFSILPVLYTQDTFVPFSNFEVGHFVCHFLFLSFAVAMKVIQFIQLRCHISFLLFTRLTTYFLSIRGRMLNSCKRRLFHLHTQHTTHCLFERRTPVGSSEAVVCGFCLSISLYKLCCNFTMGKSDEYTKHHLSLLIQEFIRHYPS